MPLSFCSISLADILPVLVTSSCFLPLDTTQVLDVVLAAF
jgi:hypothetical protein